MQQGSTLHSLLYLETALHVSGGTTTHHQERKQSICSIWYLSDRYCYLPLAAGNTNGLTNTKCCRYICLRS